jgi:hypothetical protein
MQAFLLRSRTDPDLRSLAETTRPDGVPRSTWLVRLTTTCGYAALTTMDAGAEVLTVEFKINLLAPAAGERLVARGRVLRSGRTLTACRGDAVTISGGQEKHVATMTAALIAVREPASELWFEGEICARFGLREGLDDLDQLFAAIAVAPRELDQLARPCVDGALGRCPRDGDAAAPAEVE